MIRVLIFLSVLGTALCSCPSGFELIRDGECRGYYTTVHVAHNAELDVTISKCKEIKAQPVIIHTEEQNIYWTQMEDTLPIGIVCNTKRWLWEWADGSPIDYKPPHGTQNADLGTSCKTGCVWQGETANADWTKHCDGSKFDKKIFCTLQLHQPTVDGCENFEDDPQDGICYKVQASAQTWKDAQSTCQKIGANVASIHNLKENSFVRKLASSAGAINGVFIGAAPSGKGNQFGWIDGSPWDYQNFYPGFPIPGHGDCLAMDTISNSGEWMNMDCNSKMAVACAREAESAEPKHECTSGPWNEGETIYTPGYPYASSEPCDYFLSVDAGKKVQVKVVLLEANTCCDRLVLVDDLLAGNLVANLTGEISNKSYTTKSSNFMRVSWQPQGGVNVRGAMFTFTAV